MKIRQLASEDHAKVSALLRQAFPGNTYYLQLIESLHKNQKALHEWVCIHCGRIAAYIAFSNAYDGKNICGFHLAPLAVSPQFRRQGIGSELLRFSLRQPAIKEATLFALGAPGFFRKFGFESCRIPACPFDKNNVQFSSLRNTATSQYTVGYEPEFKKGPGVVRPGTHKGKKKRKR